MLAWGFSEADLEKTVEVWECNVPTLDLFRFMGTQWRVGGMGLPTGLDYNVLYRKMDRMNLTAEEYDRIEDEIRIMEAAALEAMRPADE